MACLLAASFGACGASESPPPNCPTEPRSAGALPDLEALLPFVELPGVVVDSGWNCLPESLRSYARHGISRLEFAGVTLRGDDNDTVAVVLRTGTGDPPLQAAWVEEFYEGSARESGRVDNIEISREPFGDGGPVIWRLDGLNGLSFQSVLVWQDGPVVRAVIVATEVGPDADPEHHEAIVASAIVNTQLAPDPPSVPVEPSVLPSAA